MPWWEYESASKYPAIPAADDAEVSRAGLGGSLILLGVLTFLAFVVAALLFRVWTVALWGIAASVLVSAIGGWLLPKSTSANTPAR